MNSNVISQQESLDQILKTPSLFKRIGYFKRTGNLHIFFNLCNSIGENELKDFLSVVFGGMNEDLITNFFSQMFQLSLSTYCSTTDVKLNIINKRLKELICTKYQNQLDDFIYFHWEKGDPVVAVDTIYKYLKTVKENRPEDLPIAKKHMKEIKSSLEQWASKEGCCIKEKKLN